MGRSDDLNEILNHDDHLQEIENGPGVRTYKARENLYTGRRQGTFAMHQSRYSDLWIQRYLSI